MAELEDSLEELEDGLDVLMILEKAYQKTMQDHVAVPTPTEKASAAAPPSQVDRAAPPQTCAPPQPQDGAPRRPRVEGSSTALVAVLDHSHPRTKPARPLQLFGPSPRRTRAEPAVSERGATLTIAHLGDCMGMLIRGEEIVWRTEEMWWNVSARSAMRPSLSSVLTWRNRVQFNTPVQLGPASTTRPRDAQVFRVPVQADDILILASDGLSDNLWDEDVLDEVVRFRRPCVAESVFGRSALAAMLSEALCSRARRAAEGRAAGGPEQEVPFARRARELGRAFQGGKPDGECTVLVRFV